MIASATSPSASATSEGRDLSDSASNPARIPILYVILGVLLVISIVPMYFYSAQVEAINRDRLKTNEMLLQNTVTRSLADDLSQHERSLRMMLDNLSSAIQVASGGDIGGKNIEATTLILLNLSLRIGFSSEHFGDKVIATVFRLFVTMRLLPFGKFNFLPLDLLVRNDA